MAQSNSISRYVAASRLTLANRIHASRHGFLDGRRGIPPLPPAHERAGADRVAPWTPFMGQAEDAARRVSRQLLGSLYSERQNRDLIQRANALAEIVVYHHDILERLSPGQRGRFATAMASWAATVGDCRSRASAAVDHANQLVGWYWLKLLRHHWELQDEPRPPGLEGWRPARITLDPIWDKPDALLPQLVDGEDQESTGGNRVLLRAIQILTLHLPPERRAGGVP